MRNFSQSIGGLGDLRGAAGLFGSRCSDFLRELINLGNNVGNFFEREAEVFIQQQAFLHHAGALFHVIHGFPRFLLYALNQFGNFLGGLCGFFSELAHFFGDDGEA